MVEGHTGRGSVKKVEDGDHERVVGKEGVICRAYDSQKPVLQHPRIAHP